MYPHIDLLCCVLERFCLCKTGQERKIVLSHSVASRSSFITSDGALVALCSRSIVFGVKCPTLFGKCEDKCRCNELLWPVDHARDPLGSPLSIRLRDPTAEATYSGDQVDCKRRSSRTFSGNLSRHRYGTVVASILSL